MIKASAYESMVATVCEGSGKESSGECEEYSLGSSDEVAWCDKVAERAETAFEVGEDRFNWSIVR